MQNLHKTSALIILTLLTGLLLACSSEATSEQQPTPTPTRTRIPAPPRNDNVEALNSAQAAVGDFEFGFAPLLLDKETRIQLQDAPGGQVARMNYPQQPTDPTEWLAVDSFALSYAVRQALLNSAQVNRVSLGQFGTSASIGNMAERVDHTAVWITFVDGSRAIIDLSPLSTNFAPRHIPETMIVDDVEIEKIFARLRSGVNLDQLQPMLVIEQNSDVYYLLARVMVSYDRYDFSLRLHPVQIADPIKAMEIRPGLLANIDIARVDFEKLQTLLLDRGPDIFAEQPDLLTYDGNLNEPLSSLMAENVHLLWHLITKFDHELPDPTQPTPTPLPTATPVPTPTPTPTATPQKLPLITS